MSIQSSFLPALLPGLASAAPPAQPCVRPSAGDAPLLVVTPCGGAKAHVPTTADALYTGGYALACLRLARLLAGRASGAHAASVRILSAKHGLLVLDTVVAPYDVTFGDPAAIGVAAVRAQAAEAGLLGARVVALGGDRYRQIVKAIWPGAETPMTALPQGRRGIGHQLAWLKGEIARLSAPAA